MANWRYYNWRHERHLKSKKSSKKRRKYSDAQRAAYWKKKYLALLKSRSR